MKKIILIPVLALILHLSSCGPAAENRATMHSRAKVFQDSIANAIRMQMAEAEVPSGAAGVPDTASQRINSSAPQ